MPILIRWSLLALLGGAVSSLENTFGPGLRAYAPGEHGNKITNDEALMRMRTFHPEERNTFEEWPVRNDEASEQAIFDRFLVQENIGGHFVQGHAFVLHNPLGHFSFNEPVGGCGGNRQRPSDTMKAEACIVATNAGFFDTGSGDCLGTLVTGGHVQQNTGYQNSMFGINKEGHFVTGYLDGNQVADDDGVYFDELIAGVLWLVRDGQPYVTESLRVENMTVQETGDAFATIQSARTAVGHDRLGRVIILSIDGKSYQRGVNLFEMAELLTKLGVENAINLDGGGSATVGIDSIVVNQPSDECGTIPGGDLKKHCERAVTSITCIHD